MVDGAITPYFICILPMYTSNGWWCWMPLSWRCPRPCDVLRTPTSRCHGRGRYQRHDAYQNHRVPRRGTWQIIMSSLCLSLSVCLPVCLSLSVSVSLSLSLSLFPLSLSLSLSLWDPVFITNYLNITSYRILWQRWHRTSVSSGL